MFSAITPLRPVALPHPLAEAPKEAEGTRGYEAPPTETVLAADLVQALGLYDDVSDTLRNEWIEEAKQFNNLEQLNARLLSAVFVLLFRAQRARTVADGRTLPPPAAFRQLSEAAVAPLLDARIPAAERRETLERLQADLLRMSKWVVAQRIARYG